MRLHFVSEIYACWCYMAGTWLKVRAFPSFAVELGRARSCDFPYRFMFWQGLEGAPLWPVACAGVQSFG
jgi:hypothetical protein